MAAVGYGPGVPFGHGDQSDTTVSSPHSTTTASESPRTATRLYFAVSLTGSPGEQGREEIVPKIEEVDEEELEDTKGVLPSPPEEEVETKDDHAVAKRPRGRPRKHPREPSDATPKPLKGRSKTGCITCRRRKKKCDETKPACMHCQKNNVHCEGYPPKDYWQSGKQRAVKSRRFSIETPRELPTLIEGVEDELDWSLFDHFNLHVSRVLSLFTEKNNPWTHILLPMATAHRGLMHSLLCLSAAHLQARESDVKFEERQLYHFGEAIANLRTNGCIAVAASPKPGQPQLIDDPTIAQTLVLCLKSICAGEVDGSYCPHLTAARHLVITRQASDPDFQAFLFEFFIYHDVCNSITKVDHCSVLMRDDLQLPDVNVEPEGGAWIGVLDGLFGTLSKIRKLRDSIRARRVAGVQPFVDYSILNEARALDDVLRKWVCVQQLHSPRWFASMLYRQCIWLYLHRTVMVMKPVSNGRLHETVEVALEYMREIPADSPTQSIMLMPLFLLGCSAYSSSHREEIMQAFENLHNFSNLGNVTKAAMLVEKMWELMDAGDDDAWDWEGVMQKMDWDFLIT